MVDNKELGRILAYVGGVLGLISGISLFFPSFGLNELFDLIGYGFEIFQYLFVGLGIISVLGGIVTIIGASLIQSKGTKTAGIVVIIGSVIAGLNLISLIGGILLTGALDKSSSSTYSTAPPNQIHPAVPLAKYCKNCGAPLQDDTNFCQSCGEPTM